MQRRRLRTVAMAAVVTAATATAQNPRLNEVYASHSGPDVAEFIELVGLPGQPLDGVMVLSVDGDAAVAGELDRAWDLTGHAIPPDGYFVLGDTAVQEKDYDLGAANSLENGTQTLYLVQAPDPGAVLMLLGTNVDPDGDGVTQLDGSLTFFDFLCIADAGYPFQDRAFDGAPVIGPDGPNLPAGVYRGGDDPTGWCGGSFLDFDLQANAEQPRTPGAPNPVCVAQVRSHKGLEHETFGLAGLAVDPDGALRVTNLGSSGDDGVTIGTEGAASYAVAVENPYAGPIQPTAGSAVMTIEAERGTLGGLPQVKLELSTELLPVEIRLSLKFEKVGEPGDCDYIIVYVYNGFLLVDVYTIPCPDQLVDFATLPPASSVLMQPDVLYGGDEFRCVYQLPQAGPISVLGQPPVQADRLVVAVRNLPALPATIGSTRIRGTDVGSLRLLDETISMFGNRHRGLSQAALDPDADAGTLRVAGLTQNAPFGVRVEAEDAHGLDLELAPMAVDINNGVLTAGASGVYQGAPSSLGSTELVGTGQAALLLADFSTFGLGVVELVVLDGGIEQGSTILPAGLLAQLVPNSGGALPPLVGCGKLPGDVLIPAPPCFWWGFDGPVIVTPSGGQPLVGDEVRVLATGAPGVVESLESFSLLASGLPEIVLLSEDAVGDCDLQRTCIASQNSTGPGAKVELAGGCEIGVDVLELRAAPVPNQPGIFFFGTTSIQVPFGDGFRCVGGSTKRLPPTLASGNVLSTQVSLISQPSGLSLMPGDVRGIQAWYRDPAAAGSGFNLSDAVFVTFQ